MRVFVILLLPLHRIWKIGRVIECAGLEIRYTPFGYRGFESLIFRKHFNKPKGMFGLAKTNNNRCKTNVLQRFLFPLCVHSTDLQTHENPTTPEYSNSSTYKLKKP